MVPLLQLLERWPSMLQHNYFTIYDRSGRKTSQAG
jgi:hypothetical protein